MVVVDVFMTGATGYIGGDILWLINKRQPAWKVSCLVRDPSKAAHLISRYPSVRVVQGSLDSTDLIEEEAANARLIYHCASSDNRASALAITRGMARSRLDQVYWIHTSGAGILTHQNFARSNYETATMKEKIYDDWDNIGELTSLPDQALHRHVDRIVLGASIGNEERIKTAIIAPPAIYGRGRGTGNCSSVQINVAIRVALKNGQALRMGDGNNIWHGIHIADLSELYLLLGEAAAAGGGKATWNSEGYYLAENEAFRWGDVIQAVADETFKQGFVPTNEVRSIGFAEAQVHHKQFPYLCGTTSRGMSKRARNLLGWDPQRNTLKQELPLIIRDEVKTLGLWPQRSGKL